jgi:hypothetical protein
LTVRERDDVGDVAVKQLTEQRVEHLQIEAAGLDERRLG